MVLDMQISLLVIIQTSPINLELRMHLMDSKRALNRCITCKGRQEITV